MKLLFTVLFCLLLTNLSECVDECFDTIKKLAEKDRCLSSRLDFLISKAEESTTAREFASGVVLASSETKCSGDQSNCGLTMGYLTEAFLGLENQFEFFKKFDGEIGTEMGFQPMIGDSIRQLFQANEKSNYHWIYLLRHTGTEDHVWIVEQVPNQKGYRIYQSYHDAYSLKAWLSPSIDGLFEAQNGQIKLFVDLKKTVNDLIINLSGGKFNLTTFDDTIFDDTYKHLKEFAKYVRDYDEKEAVGIFRQSWEKFGKGQLITWEALDEYLQKLANLTEYLNKTDSTANLFSRDMYNDWKLLFGAANPVNFPDMPANAIMSIISPDRVRTYRFEVKAISFNSSEPDCLENSRALFQYASIPVSSGSGLVQVSLTTFLVALFFTLI